MVSRGRAIADTSLFTGLEPSRVDHDVVGFYDLGVSVVTLSELRLGVLQAQDPEVAARRLSAYQVAQRFRPLVIDENVSEAWALLVTRLRAAESKVPLNDSWIAATAMAHEVPVMTQNAEYESVPDLDVIRI